MWLAVTASSIISPGFSLASIVGELLLQFGNPAIGEFARALEFAAALRVGQFDAQGVELALQLLRVGELVLLRAPARRQRRRFLLEIGQFLFQRLQAALGADIGFLLQRLLLDLQPDDFPIHQIELFRLESTCIFSRADASSIRSIALSGRKRSVM